MTLPAHTLPPPKEVTVTSRPEQSGYPDADELDQLVKGVTPTAKEWAELRAERERAERERARRLFGDRKPFPMPDWPYDL
jgi:hypothetical protein